MKKALFLVCFLFPLFHLYGQDVINKVSGEIIHGRVITIAKDTITFNIPETGNSVLTLAKSELESIHFWNGVDMYFRSTLEVDSVYFPDKYDQGINDARQYYTHYRGAGTATLLTSMVFPVIGLIPAVACSSTPPSVVNLGFPDSSLARDPDYAKGYAFQAKKIKSKKVWKNYGIGAGVGMSYRILYVIVLGSLIASILGGM